MQHSKKVLWKNFLATFSDGGRNPFMCTVPLIFRSLKRGAVVVAAVSVILLRLLGEWRFFLTFIFKTGPRRLEHTYLLYKIKSYIVQYTQLK